MAATAIQIESREPEWIKSIRIGGIPVIVSRFDAGDAMIATDDGKLLLVERKTPTDLLNCLKDNRLFIQIKKMRELSTFCYLVVSGMMVPTATGKTLVNYSVDIDGDGSHREHLRITEWDWFSIQGALLTVQECGCNVMMILDDSDYADTLAGLGSRSRDSKRIDPVRDMSVVSDEDKLLTSLPGIGPTKAAALLSHCGNAANALAFLTTFGIRGAVAGDKTKRRIKRAMGMSDDECLVVSLEESKDSEIVTTGNETSGNTIDSSAPLGVASHEETCPDAA